MQNDTATDLEDELMTLIAAAMPGGITNKQLHDQSQIATQREEVVRTLGKMRAEQRISIDGARWRIRKSPVRTPAPKRSKAGVNAPPPEGNTATDTPPSRDFRESREYRALNARAIQEAVDTYISVIADMDTLRALFYARDTAQSKLDALDTTTGEG